MTQQNDNRDVPPIFVVLRIDTDCVSGDPGTYIAAKGVTNSYDKAVKEVARLNKLNGHKNCVYFWQRSRTL